MLDAHPHYEGPAPDRHLRAAMKGPPPRVLAVVLHFGSIGHTEACVTSLEESIHRPDILVVVNGHRNKGIESAVGSRCRIIATGENLGFARGNNVGIRLAIQEGYDYTLVINNDTRVTKKALGTLVDVLERDASIALVGPLIRTSGDDNGLWAAGGTIKPFSMQTGPSLSIRNEDHWEVDYLPGACLLVRNEALIACKSLIPARYFLSGEEAELALRLRQCGYRIRVCRRSVIYHHVGISSKHSPGMDYNAVRNHILLVTFAYGKMLGGMLAVAWIVRRIARKQLSARLALRAVVDHFRYEEIRAEHVRRIESLEARRHR